MNLTTAVDLRVAIKAFANTIAHPINRAGYSGLPGISMDTLAACDLMYAEADAIKEHTRIDRIYSNKSALVGFLLKHLPYIIHQLCNKGDIIRALRAIRVIILMPSVSATVVLRDALAASSALIAHLPQ